MKITFEGNPSQIKMEMRAFLGKEIIEGKPMEECLQEVRIPAIRRKHFTEFETNFITDNYRKKSINWIALKLCRDKLSIYNLLTKLYKKGLPRKNNRTKNI